MPGWIPHIDVFSLLLGALISTLVAAWYGLLVKQPKLKVTGGGGGKDLEFSHKDLTVQNSLGWFGLRLEESQIVGIRVHGSIEYGLPIERNTARDCVARLCLKEGMQHVANLYWVQQGNNYETRVDIGSGEQAQLKLFARYLSGPPYCFVFSPDPNDNSRPAVPPEVEMFKETTEFIIVITHSRGTRQFKVGVTLTKEHGGWWGCSISNKSHGTL